MKCVIADDHGMLRTGLKELLKTIDPTLELSEAENYNVLLEKLAAEPDTDLILLDLVLPGTSGLEGLKKLKTQWPSTAVIMVSSTEDPAIIRAAISSGASGYVPKSTPVELLPSAFQLIFAGGVYIPPIALASGSVNEVIGNELDYEQNFVEENLSGRQKKVLIFIADGLSNKEIADRLDLAEQTIKNEVSRIFKVLGVANRAQATGFIKKNFFL